MLWYSKSPTISFLQIVTSFLFVTLVSARLSHLLFHSNNSDMNSASPTNNVVLMRGHDMAVIGLDIVTAVFRAIYTQSIAEIRRDALILSALGCTDGQPPGKSRRIRYLTEREKHDSIALDTTFFNRAWELWVREVDAAATGELYRNSLGSPL